MSKIEWGQQLARLAPQGWFARQPQALRDYLLAHARELEFAPGAWLYGTAEEAAGLYAVLQGNVRLHAALGRGDQVLVDLVGPGLWFGQAGVQRGMRRVVTATAATPLRVLLVPRTFLASAAHRGLNLWQSIAGLDREQMENLVQVMAETLALGPRARVAARLCSLHRRNNAPDPESGLPISQAELAEMVGFERKTVQRILADFEDRELIAQRYRSIRIKNARRLSDISAHAQD
jgi:CRP/FNR family cyclic AMP-dependent transcriptional regulator